MDTSTAPTLASASGGPLVGASDGGRFRIVFFDFQDRTGDDIRSYLPDYICENFLWVYATPCRSCRTLREGLAALPYFC
jgi:hypothetical protein